MRHLHGLSLFYGAAIHFAPIALADDILYVTELDAFSLLVRNDDIILRAE